MFLKMMFICKPELKVFFFSSLCFSKENIHQIVKSDALLLLLLLEVELLLLVAQSSEGLRDYY